MAETYKVLGQALTGELALDGTTVKETVVYKVPAGKKASISAVELTNSGGSSTSYKVAYVPSADVASATGSINYNVSSTVARYVSLSSYSNVVSYSTDGITWQETTLPVESSSVGSWSFVSRVGGKYFASNPGSGIGVRGKLVSSTDGITWSDVLQFDARAVAYYNGVYVAVGGGVDNNNYQTDQNVAYSTDGVNWTFTSATPGIQAVLTSIVAGGYKVLAIDASGRIVESTNGATWNQAANLSQYGWSSIAFGNGTWVAAATQHPSFPGDYNVAYSTDGGYTWSTSNLPDGKIPKYVRFVNDKFMLQDMYSNTLFYSIGGNSWTVVSQVAGNFNSSGMTYGNNTYVAVAGGTSYTSLDGFTWSPHYYSSSVGTDVAYASITTTQTMTQSIPASLNKHVAIYNKPITSNVTHELTGGVTLSEGDEIRVYSTSTALIAHVYGVELTSNINYKILGQLYYGAEVIHHPGTPGTPGTPGNGYGYGYGNGGNPGTPGTDPWDESLIQPQVLYTVPAGVQTTSTAIYVTNHDSTTRTYDLAVVPSGETLSLKHHIRWDMPVSPSDFDIVTAKLTLSAGDKIYVFPSTVDKVGFTAFGLEK